MKNLFRTNLTALLTIAAGLLFASSAYAWTIGKGDVYFDNTVTGWEKVYIRFGTSGGATVYQMSKVEGNDNIYMYTFPSDATNLDAIQFASTDGYNVTTNCNSDCGIYNGNVIPAGQKTAYIKTNIDGGTRLIVATGNTNFCAVEGPYTMPSSVSDGTTTLGGGTIASAATVGYFTAGQELAFTGSATLGYGTAPAKDLVHATFKYYLEGTDYTDISCAGNESATKSFSTTVNAPEAVGKYTMSTYYRCGGVSSDAITSYYHVIGLTGHDINFGAIPYTGSSTKTESLTDVWGGDNVETVTASIYDGTYFKFTDETHTGKSVTITDKAGSVDIVFTPVDMVQRTDTLILTVTYDTDKTLTKKYVLTGIGHNNTAAVIKSSKATVLIGPKATLHAYIQYTGCEAITERGFYYGTSAIDPKNLSASTKVTASEKSELTSGDTWDCSIPASGNLETNQTYYYRPYILTSSGSVTTLSESDYTFQTTDACNYDLSGDTIYMQVDKSFAAGGDSACTLKFRELQGAIDFIKGSSVFYNSTTKVLKYNIVLEVAPASANYIGTGTTGTTGGEATDLSTIIFQDINNTTDVSTGYDKSLVIRSSSATQMPTIQHPTIRNSRNITFENVRITGSQTAGSKGYDNAVDIDTNNSGWTGLSVGAFANANINFKSCYIYSMGFTCLHVAAYDGVTFEDCDIEADLPSTMLSNANTIYWGASAKFIKCKNIKFLRNNFRGSHATSVWIQGVIGMLAMNNVFWNDNDSYNSDYADNGTFFRLVTQQAGDGATADLNQKIGIYYNTLYIDENTSQTAQRHFDFIRLGSSYKHNNTTLNANLDQNQYSTIRFMYNNCYSYDQTGVVGANQNTTNKWCLTATESNWCTSINKNNYWSMWGDEYTANFIIPNTTSCSSNKYYTVNVYEQVCKSASDDPGTLVIKGDGLNYGSHIAEDISGLGDNTYYNDRLHASNGADAVRAKDGEWTLGAYQQGAASDPIETIVWWGDVSGDEDNWDNRYNWRKLDGTRVTCVDNFATDLKVIIPAPNSTTYPIPEGGITTYPFLPSKFSGTRTKNSQETVNAGHGITNPSKFAGTIEVEAGAAMLGVTALADDEGRYYDEVTNHFEAGRKEYILVGTVVKPFTDSDKTATRLIQSGDYFLNYTPQVYMRQAYINEDAVNWNVPFTSLEESVDYDKVFAIMIPNQYGYYKFASEIYYKVFDKNPAMLNDGTQSKTFDFNGWFLNDEVYPEYKVSGATLICNTYPANIDVASAAELNSGTVYYYDYSVRNFVSYDPSTALDKEIKSQNGFMFVPGGSNDGYFRISKEMLLSTSTKYKSAVAVKPFFYLSASNANGDGGSVAAIIYDELKSDEYDSDVDMINKTIDNTTTQPEISVEMYGKELDKVYVPDLTQAIPLKLVCGAKMTVEFAKYSVGDMETVTLEDRETGETYDLLTETASIALAKGTYTGRFYLNLSEAEEPLPTDVDDVTSGDASIDIYGDSKAVIISSSDNVILKGAEITDMAGRTTYVELTGAHYNKVNISGAQGVYVVKAIGDVMSETTKVIVK